MAQSASAAKPAEKAADDTVVLNPFTISAQAERGYTSSEVVSASRFNEKIKNVPQTIVVLTDSFLKDVGAQNMSDIMPMVGAMINPGVRAQDSFSIRGFAVNQLYVDGVRDVQEWGGGDFAHVQQIEVIKGPASNLFGNSRGFGGIINRISKRPKSTPFQQAAVTVGDYDNYRGTIDTTGPITADKKWLYRLNASYTNAGSYRDLHTVQRLFAAPVIEWKPTPSTDITVFGEFMHQRHSEDNNIPVIKNAATGLFELTVPISRSIDEPWQKSLIDKQTVRITADQRINQYLTARVAGFQTYINNPIQQVEYLGLGADNRTVSRRAFNLNRWEDYTFYEAALLGSVTTGFIKHQMAVSYDYYYAKFRSNVRRAPLASIDLYNPVYGAPMPDFYAPNATLATNTLGDGSNPGSTATYQANAFKDTLILVAGIRHDHVTSHRNLQVPGGANVFDPPNSADSPRYGALYRPIPQVAAYYQYSKTFAPNLGAGFKLDGSPLDPTDGKSSEYGIKLSLFNDRLQATAAAFKVESAGAPLRLDPPNNSFFANGGTKASDGGEVNITYNDETYTVMAGWVSQDLRNTTGGIQGTTDGGTPKNQGQFFVRRKWKTNSFGGLAIGAGVIYQSERPLNAGVAALQNFPAYSRYYLNAGYGIRKGLFASLAIGNLTDKRYFWATGLSTWRPAEPRTIRLTLSQTW